MKNGFGKQTWFWLMLLSILIAIKIVLCVYLNFSVFWDNIASISEIITGIVAIISFLFAVVTYKRDKERIKKENTLDAIMVLQKEVFDNLTDEKIENAKKQSWNMSTITKELCRIEQFAVGVNQNIYDIETVNRMAGILFISKYDKLYPIIEKKREKSTQNYVEFRDMVNELIKIRNKKKELYGCEKYRD